MASLLLKSYRHLTIAFQKVFCFLFVLLISGADAQWLTSSDLPIDGCDKNEKRVACDYNCEPQCGWSPVRAHPLSKSHLVFQNICSFECRRNVCVCKDGFVRNTRNECVHRLECAPETSRCPEGEEFQTCGALCQPSCEDPNPKFCPSKRCARNVCRCKSGLVRNGAVCTTLAECRKYPSRPLELFTY